MNAAPDQPGDRASALPQLTTLASLLCGFGALVWAVEAPATASNLLVCAGAVTAAILFDWLDGRLARWTGATSAFGAELDSLADLVAFGVAPAVVALRWGLDDLGVAGALCAFAFVAGGAWRLARFNTLRAGGADGRWFVGLSIPVAAGGALVACAAAAGPGGAAALPPGALAAAMVALALLMVSRLRYPSFKTASARAWLMAALLAVPAAGLLAVLLGPVWAAASLLAGYLVWPALARAYPARGAPRAPARALDRRLYALVAREALAPPEDAVHEPYVAWFRRHYGPELAGVVFYGSCLSAATRAATSTPDFFVITDAADQAVHPRWARWLRGWLPPNSLSVRLPGTTQPFKYLHLDRRQLAAATSVGLRDLFVAGRLSKRVKLVYWRDDLVRDEIVQALTGAAQCVGALALARSEAPFRIDDLMSAYVGLSYLSEWRVDPEGKVDALLASAPAYYRRLCGRLLVEARRQGRLALVQPGLFRSEGPVDRRAAERLLARSRRRAAWRWPKYLLTMRTAAELLAAKLRRVRPDWRLPAVAVRHPLLFAVPILLLLVCTGVVRTHRPRRTP